LSFSERERFAERVGVPLDVEEEAPNDMVAMAAWLIETAICLDDERKRSRSRAATQAG
jgi:hypothetical protein